MDSWNSDAFLSPFIHIPDTFLMSLKRVSPMQAATIAAETTGSQYSVRFTDLRIWIALGFRESIWQPKKRRVRVFSFSDNCQI